MSASVLLTPEQIEKTVKKRRQVREWCLSDLFYLVTEIMYPHDKHKYGELHQWMAAKVGKERGTSDLWLLPRDHFKTTILTIGHAVQQILRNPMVSLLIVSRKDEHAHLMSEEIRRQFVFNERLRYLFPGWCAPTLDDLGAKGEWTTPAKRGVQGEHANEVMMLGGRRREPTCTATGIKSTQQSRHYNVGYFDDCMDAADTTEVGLREIMSDFKELIPLIDIDGIKIICGTRKHYNDIYHKQIETRNYKVYVRHGLESAAKMCDMTECSKFAEPHAAADLRTGVALCPERMNRTDYERKLRECEIDPKTGVSYFFHEYMNIPFAPSDRIFQPGWFKQVDPLTIPPIRTMMLAVDTAWKEEEHPTGFDYTVVVRAGWDNEGRLYIFNILRSRTWTAKQGCGEMAEQMKTHGITSSHLITEKVGDISWHAFLRDECRIKGVPYSEPLMLTRGGSGVLGRRSKTDRIRAIQGYFETGKVLFSRDCEFFQEAVDEFCNLGKWTNDDIADAISMFFDERVIVAPPSRATTGQQPVIRPMPFEEEWRRSGIQRVDAANDPLGRYGADGPASRGSVEEALAGRAGSLARERYRIDFPGNTQHRDEGFNWAPKGGGV